MYKNLEDMQKAHPEAGKMPPGMAAKCMAMANDAMGKGMPEEEAWMESAKKCQELAEGSDNLFALSDKIELEEGATISVIEVLREGVIRDRGLKITRQMLEDYARNWRDKVYGNDVQVNFGHDREGEAAGWVRDLYVEAGSDGVAHLMAKVEWTPAGATKLRDKAFQFVSSELAPEYPHADTGKPIKNVFIGAGLTNIPAMKRQEPIQLSEIKQDKQTIHSHSQKAMLKNLIEDLKGRTKLSEADVKFAKKMLAEATEEDQVAAKADVEALETRQAEEAKKEADALSEKNKNTVSLSEHLALKERIERTELSQKVDESIVLSEKRDVGIVADGKEKVVAFMLKLSEAQRAEFLAIMGEVKHVSLGEIGSSHAKDKDVGGSREDRVIALTEKKVAEAKKAGKNVDSLLFAELQKEAAAEVTA